MLLRLQHSAHAGDLETSEVRTRCENVRTVSLARHLLNIYRTLPDKFGNFWLFLANRFIHW